MSETTVRHRLLWLDLARTAAVVGMVIFHVTFDLQMFGHVPPGTTFQPFWHYFARTVAGSFLFLSGISLWLAHGQGLRWPAFWRRFAKIAGAAVLVSVVSHWTTPDAPIHFGILHGMAACSLIAVVFLRMPPIITLAFAAVSFALPWWVQHPALDPLWLIWTGLSETRPSMVDYVPIFPWLAPCLAGLAFAKLGALPHLSLPPTPMLSALGFPGRHSLVIYLLHQPLLIAGFTAYARLTQG
jgi:uncharacterized membrane protein